VIGAAPADDYLMPANASPEERALNRSVANQVRSIRSVRHQPARSDIFGSRVNRRQPVLDSQAINLAQVILGRYEDEATIRLGRECSDAPFQFGRSVIGHPNRLDAT
jgi:hypothetical protein